MKIILSLLIIMLSGCVNPLNKNVGAYLKNYPTANISDYSIKTTITMDQLAKIKAGLNDQILRCTDSRKYFGDLMYFEEAGCTGLLLIGMLDAIQKKNLDEFNKLRLSSLNFQHDTNRVLCGDKSQEIEFPYNSKFHQLVVSDTFNSGLPAVIDEVINSISPFTGSNAINNYGYYNGDYLALVAYNNSSNGLSEHAFSHSFICLLSGLGSSYVEKKNTIQSLAKIKKYYINGFAHKNNMLDSVLGDFYMPYLEARMKIAKSNESKDLKKIKIALLNKNARIFLIKKNYPLGLVISELIKAD